MSAPPWMPLHIGPYVADTGHLSTLEHGAYFLLIMHYWQHDGLPTEDNKLARIARMSADGWSEIRDTMAALFKENWRHKRIDVELANAKQLISKRSAAGKAGVTARYIKRMAEVNQLRNNRIIDRIAVDDQSNDQSDSIVRVGYNNINKPSSLGSSTSPREEKKDGQPEGSSQPVSAAIEVSSALAAKYTKPKPPDAFPDIPEVLKRTA